MAITGKQACCILWCHLYFVLFNLNPHLESSMTLHLFVCIQLACILTFLLHQLGSKLVFPCLVAISFMAGFGVVYTALNWFIPSFSGGLFLPWLLLRSRYGNSAFGVSPCLQQQSVNVLYLLSLQWQHQHMWQSPKSITDSYPPLRVGCSLSLSRSNSVVLSQLYSFGVGMAILPN